MNLFRKVKLFHLRKSQVVFQKLTEGQDYVPVDALNTKEAIIDGRKKATVHSPHVLDDAKFKVNDAAKAWIQKDSAKRFAEVMKKANNSQAGSGEKTQTFKRDFQK